MFEQCTSLEDLSRERLILLQQGASPTEVSKAFNVAKSRVLGQIEPYKPIKVHRAKTYNFNLTAAFIPLGTADKKNTIVVTEEGIYA